VTEVREDQHFTVQDPRNFDGDPYQVAERAVQQQAALVALLLEYHEATMLMVRNADLERSLAAGIPLDEIAPSWPESPQGRKLSSILENLEGARDDLRHLQRAASYNPKAR